MLRLDYVYFCNEIEDVPDGAPYLQFDFHNYFQKQTDSLLQWDLEARRLQNQLQYIVEYPATPKQGHQLEYVVNMKYEHPKTLILTCQN